MNDIKIPFIIDPKTKNASVSLTLLIISFIGVIISNILMLTKSIDTVAFTEVFLGCSALYFGRQFQFKKGDRSLTSEKKETTNV